MINKIDTLSSVEKETQYLKETREYIDNLKNILIEKILGLQQNKKKEIRPQPDANANTLDKFILATEKKSVY
jgi:hypothetical protein